MFRRIWRSIWIFGLTLALLLPLATILPGDVAAQEGAPLAIQISADGPLTPAMGEYLKRGIRIAERRGAEVLIFQLDTPGGSIDLTQDTVELIRGSDIPIVVYIAPRGAIAGSAGTVITVAGHAAAMAPETAIGAASPVGGQGEDLGETIESKLKESLKATVRSLMERRPPEAVALAEAAIDDAKAASAREALDAGLIDAIANDLDDLLIQLDGFTVETASGERTLNLSNVEVTTLALSPLEQLLQFLTNPNIVFLLLTVGVQAILFELGSPGGWVPGFIGVVSLALATFGLGLLPVNWFGIVFIATAFVLFALEVKAPTKGALTAAGIASFIVGALVLFNSPNTPDFQRVSIPLVIATAILSAGMIAVIMSFAMRAQKAPIRSGHEALVGKTGIARADLDPRGSVQLGGEMWTAELSEGQSTIDKGSRVEVVEVDRLKLRVRKK